MSTGNDNEVTRLLNAAALGDAKAAEELLPLVYTELRKLAKSRMARLKPGQTLQPTDLVHEAYLRLVGRSSPGWKGKAHFFGAAAQAMRDVLVEHARRKLALKRGGDRKRVDKIELASPETAAPEDLLALDDALHRLERQDAQKCRVVMLRFFAGLTEGETAEVLGVTKRTIQRDWSFARAWLRTALSPPHAE